MHVSPSRPDWALVHACVARLQTRRGVLFAFGGGRDPAGRVRPAFLHHAGGDQARVAVLPVASWRPSTAEMYLEMFGQLGARDVWIVDPEGEQANHPAVEDAIGHASGIVITGGDQKRLANQLRNTLTQGALERALEDGIPIYTTSAGTMALSDVMIGGLDDDGRIVLLDGLGLLPGLTIETHVDTRQRHDRLMQVAQRRANALTVGIDEDTAMAFEPLSSRVHVLGTGSVVLIADEGPAADAPRFHAGQVFDLADMLPPAATTQAPAAPVQARSHTGHPLARPTRPRTAARPPQTVGRP